MMSATPEKDLPPPAPPQPPLPLSDPAFSLPAIVHGIDGDESPVKPRLTPPVVSDSTSSTDSVSNVLSSISSRFSRAVRLSRSDLSRTISSVVQPPTSHPQHSMSDKSLPNAHPVQDAMQPAIFLFGDSITEYSVRVTDPQCSPGWSALLRETYGEKLDLLVRGFSGYNTRWAIRILPLLYDRVKHALDIKAVTIFFGANDCVDEASPQHVPLAEYVENLTAMLNYLKSQPLPPLPILITPPALGSCREGSNRHADVLAKYAAACVSTGHSLSVPVVDLHAAMTNHQRPVDDFLCDGLHLSPAGNALVHQLLLELISETLPQINPAMPRQFPDWDLIDPNDPDKTLQPAL